MSKRRRIPVTFLIQNNFTTLPPRITVHVVLANYFSSKMGICWRCALRENCIWGAVSWESSVLFLLLKEPPQIYIFFSAWPPGTVISLSCSLLRHTVPSIKQWAISHPMAKLRSPGALISPAPRCGTWLHHDSQVKLREMIQNPRALLPQHESHNNMKIPFPFTFYVLSGNTTRFRDLVQYRI